MQWPGRAKNLHPTIESSIQLDIPEVNFCPILKWLKSFASTEGDIKVLTSLGGANLFFCVRNNFNDKETTAKKNYCIGILTDTYRSFKFDLLGAERTCIPGTKT